MKKEKKKKMKEKRETQADPVIFIFFFRFSSLRSLRFLPLLLINLSWPQWAATEAAQASGETQTRVDMQLAAHFLFLRRVGGSDSCLPGRYHILKTSCAQKTKTRPGNRGRAERKDLRKRVKVNTDTITNSKTHRGQIKYSPTSTSAHVLTQSHELLYFGLSGNATVNITLRMFERFKFV